MLKYEPPIKYRRPVYIAEIADCIIKCVVVGTMFYFMAVVAFAL